VNTQAAITAENLLPDMAWTGSRMISMTHPTSNDIILEEVATGLSRETRYGGAATAVPWSVAQHCLTALHFAEEDGIQQVAHLGAILMHDAPEYMLRDIIAPLKRYLPDYREIEARWWRETAARFGLPFDMPEIVHYYDRVTASSEKALLISPLSGDWPDMPDARAVPAAILSYTPQQAAGRFVAAARRLLRTGV